VKASFAAETLGPAARRMLLSGRPADGLPEAGPLVCTCFGVGLAVIRAAITARTAANVDDIGRALKAGTNCGSCLPELKRIVAEHAVP
jgi:assimilatory nitrate reductase catalytic subunit